MKCWKITTKSNNSLGFIQNKAGNEKNGKITEVKINFTVVYLNLPY